MTEKMFDPADKNWIISTQFLCNTGAASLLVSSPFDEVAWRATQISSGNVIIRRIPCSVELLTPYNFKGNGPICRNPKRRTVDRQHKFWCGNHVLSTLNWSKQKYSFFANFKCWHYRMSLTWSRLKHRVWLRGWGLECHSQHFSDVITVMPFINIYHVTWVAVTELGFKTIKVLQPDGEGFIHGLN